MKNEGLISKYKVLQILYESYGLRDAEKRIAELPIVRVAEKTGRWIEDVDESREWDRVRFYCSRCEDWNTYGKTKYCPGCGAKMEV